MKKQTGFISSSSSVTITYSTRTESTLVSYKDTVSRTAATQIDVWDGEQFSEFSSISQNTRRMDLIWKTYASSSYHRIESFLEAVEKLNTPYSRSTKVNMPFINYASFIDKRNIYNGFVDIVITFPCKIRLAGIELINPWVNTLTTDKENEYWKYLPSVFSIFKVNDDQVNAMLQNYTYENDVAKGSDIQINQNETSTIRPIRYDDIESDDKMTFLGRYETNWETLASYKCFFKFNPTDRASVNVKNSTMNSGTATWECKQLVIRIFKTEMSKDTITEEGVIKKKIAEYIAEKERSYGTEVNGQPVTADNVIDAWDVITGSEQIYKGCTIESQSGTRLWKFGSAIHRRYHTANEVYFTTGLEYKLGGIQLLLSPDIFSISEMKMYNYSNSTNNKVFIGEWNKDVQDISYYGAGTLKISPMIDISNLRSNAITWKHNFNIPPRYLDAKVYIKFNVDFDSFYAGDVISNLVNVDKEPLTMRITGTDVTLNISNGICFTNPETGEFMQFKEGFGIQHDREGNYDALKAANAVHANVLAAQSIVASKIEPIDASKGSAYPFELYFVVKRLF